MTKSIKQEAYTFLGKFLQTDNGSLVFGYNKNYEVVGVARTKEQLKEVIQTKGVAGVIFPMTQPHATGFDFISGEKYRGLEKMTNNIRDYVEKEKEAIYEYSTDVDGLIRENTNFMEPLMEFLDKIDANYGSGSYQPVSGHNSTYEANINLGVGCNVQVSKHGTIVGLNPTYLVVHNSTRDVDLNFYATFLARVINVDEQLMKDVLTKCLQNKG
ncbi:hypothetical protein ACQUY5_29230 [Bacillus cereus]|uniref:hypothetical protein n=1 Tax=Bacillus cereus TaxID=1396 RepID=UPI003D162F3F